MAAGLLGAGEPAGAEERVARAFARWLGPCMEELWLTGKASVVGYERLNELLAEELRGVVEECAAYVETWGGAAPSPGNRRGKLAWELRERFNR